MSISFFGTALVDILLQDISEKLEHESLYASKIHTYSPGGKALNQATCATVFGSTSILLAKHGEDEFGGLIRVELEKAGVQTDCLLVDHALPTGFVILVPEKGDFKSILISYSASIRVSDTDWNAKKNTFLESRIVAGGLELKLDICKQILEESKKAGRLVIVDPYPPEKADTEVLSFADILTPNRDEAMVISGRSINSIFAAKLAAQDIIKMGVKNVCLKLGADGVIVASDDTVEHIKPVKVQPLDTTGGGDVFAGVLASLIDRGIDLINAAKIANYASALSVTRKGAFASIPKPAELFEFMLHRGAEDRLVRIVSDLLEKNQAQ